MTVALEFWRAAAVGSSGPILTMTSVGGSARLRAIVVTWPVSVASVGDALGAATGTVIPLLRVLPAAMMRASRLTRSGSHEDADAT